MLRFHLLIIFCTPFLSFGQRQLEPSVHLKPFEQLSTATVSALVEDKLGQIWIGSQSGLSVWDGMRVKKIDEITSSVFQLSTRDSFVYVVQLNRIVQFNCWTSKIKSFKLPYSDFRACHFLDDEICMVSSNLKDTLVLDYNLSRRRTHNFAVSKFESCTLGKYKVTVSQTPNKALIIQGKDTVSITKSYCSHLLKFNDNTAFIAAHEGLIEIRINDQGELEKNVHFKSKRVEQLLLDHNHNLWVGSSENGLFQIHRNTILNEYYPQKLSDGLNNSCWSFVKLDGIMYSCTTDGMVAFEQASNEPTHIEQLTKGMLCFSALQSTNSYFIGTVDGLYRIKEGGIERIHFKESNSMDNTILQIFQEGDTITFLTKAGVHQMNSSGKMLNSKMYDVSNRISYIMKAYPTNYGYIAAKTNGLFKYDKRFNPIKEFRVKSSSVFSDLAYYDQHWWCATLDGGVYRYEGDSLRAINAPLQQLLMAETYRKGLWFTDLQGVMVFVDGKFLTFTKENGFPISEYSQAALYNDEDKRLYFAGVQGIFSFSVSDENFDELPTWHISYRNQYVPHKTVVELDYDQSIINIVPRAIITSDRNRFELSYFDGKEWLSLENGAPLILDLEYGLTTIKFRVRNQFSEKERIVFIQFNRAFPFWKRSWFMVMVGFVLLLVVLGSYFLWKYFRTRRMLKIEREEKKLSQERLRISRELHDNIGARLSHIISSLDIQLFKDQNSNELATINAFAKETMSQLRETIWAVSDKTIFLSELKQRIEHYIVQTNTISLIEIRYLDESKVDFELNATETINLFRITQESINNALKYSQAQQIIVQFFELENEVLIQISDDGVGFDIEESKRRGSGLNGMIKRAEEINAKLEIVTEKNGGVRIELTILKR